MEKISAVQIVPRGKLPVFKTKENTMHLVILDENLEPNTNQKAKKFLVPLHNLTPNFLRASANMLKAEKVKKAMFVVNYKGQVGFASLNKIEEENDVNKNSNIT